MKKLALLLVSGLVFVSCANLSQTKDQFAPGSVFSRTVANEMYDRGVTNATNISAIDARVTAIESGGGIGDAPGAQWIVSHDYVEYQIVSNGGDFYSCRAGQGHTSSADDEPGVGVNWETYWYLHAVVSSYSDQISTGDTSIEVADTGSNGEITITADGVEIMTITSSGVTMPVIAADSSIAVDDTASPVIVKLITVGETVGMWQPVKYVAAQGEGMLADANVSGLWPADCISIGDTSDDAGSSAADGEDILCMVVGYGYNTEWTVSDGARICLSETAGNLIDCSSLVWDAENDCAQEVGRVEGVDRIWFDFTKPELVHAAP